MTWDPDRYLRFADHRLRPGLELLARIPDPDPDAGRPVERVVDLGAGTGNLAAILAERWPEATVTGVDASPEMSERASADHGDLDWEVADATTWRPDHPVDVLYSNAALHWLDHHDQVFPRLRSLVAPGGVLAVQMPDNWSAPTHRIPAEILDRDGYPERARSALLRDRLADPVDYLRWVQPAIVDLWRTTYYQHLTGDHPVWTWVTGSVLRPVLDALDVDDRARFEASCRAAYAAAYPTGPDGVTVLPFSRLFLVARAPAA